jgi:hypothetical protein
VEFSDIGQYTVRLKLTDSAGIFCYNEMLVNVLNDAPYFLNDGKPYNLTIKFNNSVAFNVPPYYDYENNDVLIQVNCTPSVDQFFSQSGDQLIF